MKSTIRRKSIITIAFVAIFLILIGVFIPKTYCSTAGIIRNTKKITRGDTCSVEYLTGTVSNKPVEWSIISEVTSKDTVIDKNTGKLTVGIDEKAQNITVLLKKISDETISEERILEVVDPIYLTELRLSLDAFKEKVNPETTYEDFFEKWKHNFLTVEYQEDIEKYLPCMMGEPNYELLREGKDGKLECIYNDDLEVHVKGKISDTDKYFIQFDLLNYNNYRLKDDLNGVKIFLNGKEYTGATWTHDGRLDLRITLPVEIPVEEYNFIEGANQSIEKNNQEEKLKFRIDADFNLFNNKVYIDGNLIDSSNYSAEPGSVVLTFNNDYANTLSIGTHTLKVGFSDGRKATANFTVKKQNTSGGQNAGGNNTNAGNNSIQGNTIIGKNEIQGNTIAENNKIQNNTNTNNITNNISDKNNTITEINENINTEKEKNNPKTNDDIRIYYVVFAITLFAFACLIISSFLKSRYK